MDTPIFHPRNRRSSTSISKPHHFVYSFGNHDLRFTRHVSSEQCPNLFLLYWQRSSVVLSEGPRRHSELYLSLPTHFQFIIPYLFRKVRPVLSHVGTNLSCFLPTLYLNLSVSFDNGPTLSGTYWRKGISTVVVILSLDCVKCKSTPTSATETKSSEMNSYVKEMFVMVT